MGGEGAKGQKETITTTNNTKINQRTTPKASLSLTAAGKGPARGRSLHCPSPSHPKSKAGGWKSAPATPPPSNCNEARSSRALLLGWEQGWQQQGWPTKSHLTACQRPFVLPPAEETGLPAEEVARRERAASSPPEQGIKRDGEGKRGRGEEKQMGWRESSDSAAGAGLWGLLSRPAPHPVLLGEQEPAGGGDRRVSRCILEGCSEQQGRLMGVRVCGRVSSQRGAPSTQRAERHPPGCVRTRAARSTSEEGCWVGNPAAPHRQPQRQPPNGGTGTGRFPAAPSPVGP